MLICSKSYHKFWKFFGVDRRNPKSIKFITYDIYKEYFSKKTPNAPQVLANKHFAFKVYKNSLLSSSRSLQDNKWHPLFWVFNYHCAQSKKCFSPFSWYKNAVSLLRSQIKQFIYNLFSLITCGWYIFSCFFFICKEHI